MKTGTVYATRSVGTASGVMHTKREIAYVSARKYLGEPTGEYIVSTPTTWGVALIIDQGPDGFRVLDAVDDMRAQVMADGVSTGREALGVVLGSTSFRVGKE
ncbi:hypothetical protein ACFXMT_14120 [Streptomyces mirabilis]|uniref:hypothetical protein n=1 Tax=Streptomyces mirabilis TaxID=68239 RepID=UPI003692C57E